MQTRLPFITPLAARAKSTDKDSRLTNCLAELEAERSYVQKRPGLAVHATLGAGCAQGMIAVNGVLYAVHDGKLLQNVSAEAVASPAAWELKSSAVKEAAFQNSIMVSHDGALYVIGGATASAASNTVYKSTDGGATWAQIASSIAAGAVSAYGRIGCSFNGRMWLVAPLISGSISAQVWSSIDGVTWTQATAAAAFGARVGHSVEVMNGKMWVIAGANASNVALRDVWYSTDGVTWTQATATAGFSARQTHGSAVYNSKLWVYAGLNGAPARVNDVWSSPDGVTWTQATAAAAFSARADLLSGAVGGKLWAISGDVGVSAANNEVWSSTDGATWTLAASGAQFQRFRSASAVHDATFYFAGGKNQTGGSATGISNDAYAAGKTSPALSSYTIPDASACALFGLNQSKGGAHVFFKTSSKAYYLTVATSTLSAVSDPDYPASTVPGVVYLDGYFFVMTSNGRIHNSDLENPGSWNSLNYIDAETEPDGGVALAKQMNYVVALGQWTTELFYDAANTNASPLSRVSNGMIKIGCASGASVVELDDMLIFMSQGESAGRSITVMAGLTPRTISDRNIDKILNGDDLAGVYAYAFKLAGHTLYLLTLKTSNITLVYDFTSGIWSVWSSMTAKDPVTVTSLTSAEGIATAVTGTAHGYADGDHVTVAGATPAGYNGTVNVTYVSPTTFTYPVSGTLAAATGTITARGYSEGYFKYLAYASVGGRDLIQHETDGKIYQIKPDAYDDAGAPINLKIRTPIFDGGTSAKKFFAKLEIIGDKADTTLLCRYSDDDYATNSTYRRLSLTGQRSALRRLGSARRRNFEFRHTGSTAVRLEAMELDLAN